MPRIRNAQKLADILDLTKMNSRKVREWKDPANVIDELARRWGIAKADVESRLNSFRVAIEKESAKRNDRVPIDSDRAFALRRVPQLPGTGRGSAGTTYDSLFDEDEGFEPADDESEE